MPKTILRKKCDRKKFKKSFIIPEGYTTIYDQSDDCEACDFSEVYTDVDGSLQQRCTHPNPANSGCQDNKFVFKKIRS